MNAFLRLAAIALALSSAFAARATVTTTSNPGLITAFQAGATVINFDNLTGLSFSAYPTGANPGPEVPTGSQATAFPISGGQTVYFNSGGATFDKPFVNPGVPIGILNPDGGISADVFSQNNVAGPLVNDQNDPTKRYAFTDGTTAGFMEVIFPQNVSKVGIFVTHGSVLLILKDDTNTNLSTGDATVTGTAGQFIGLERASADVRGVTMIFSGPSTIDDFTFGGATSSNGGGGGNGGSSVPDAGSALHLVLAAGFLCMARRQFKAGRA